MAELLFRRRPDGPSTDVDQPTNYGYSSKVQFLKPERGMSLVSGGSLGLTVDEITATLDRTDLPITVFPNPHVEPMERPRLSRGELEVMDALWRLGEGTVQDVCDALPRELAYTTVMTTMRLLHARKKVLKRIKRGRAHVYRPVVSREEVGRSIVADLKAVLFQGRVSSLVLNLLQEEELSQSDIAALRAALNEPSSPPKRP